MSRHLRISAPPPRAPSIGGFDFWAQQITDALNTLPSFSISSTSNGPNSLISGNGGTILIDVGSSATTFWAKLSDNTTSGWTPFML